MVVDVRPASTGDDVARVVRAAFAGEGASVSALWADVEAEDLALASLVAVDDDEVVGHVGLSTAWVDARRELVDVWLLSPLSVLPARQGEGIGTRLVDAAIEAAREGGAPLLFLEGSPQYYGARGFERALDHGFAAPSDRTPEPAFQVVRYAAHEDWMRGRVVYRDVWWRHEAAGLRDPQLAEVEEALRMTEERRAQ
jgi:putative acetyltransferase